MNSSARFNTYERAKKGHRIFHADDMPIILDTVDDTLRSSGSPHQIVLTAGSVNEAKAYIPNTFINKAIDVALIDNSFGRNADSTGGNGPDLAAHIRQFGLNVHIVAYSAEEQTWGDSNIQKGNRAALIAALDAIPLT